VIEYRDINRSRGPRALEWTKVTAPVGRLHYCSVREIAVSRDSTVRQDARGVPGTALLADHDEPTESRGTFATRTGRVGPHSGSPGELSGNAYPIAAVVFSRTMVCFIGGTGRVTCSWNLLSGLLARR
jgi:hypothetical protein